MTSTSISIVSLRNEGFPTFCLCLTTGRHLGFTEKLRNSRSRRLFANCSWGNAAPAFSLSSQFHVCDCECYKLYSGKRCILGEGKRLGGETVGLQVSGLAIAKYIDNAKTRAEPMTYNYIEYVASYQRLINTLCRGVCLRGNSTTERRSSGSSPKAGRLC